MALAVVALNGCAHLAPAADPLPSWNEGAAKGAIVQYVKQSTEDSSPRFVPDGERAAVCDKDGSLWAEQPVYFQALFIMDRVKALSSKHHEWQTAEPYASVLKGDTKAVMADADAAPDEHPFRDEH